VRLRVAARHLPRELMIPVCGWDPALHGITAPSENPSEELAFGGQQVDIAYGALSSARFRRVQVPPAFG
jgi:hypothetical protein